MQTQLTLAQTKINAGLNIVASADIVSDETFDNVIQALKQAGFTNNIQLTNSQKTSLKELTKRSFALHPDLLKNYTTLLDNDDLDKINKDIVATIEKHQFDYERCFHRFHFALLFITVGHWHRCSMDSALKHLTDHLFTGDTNMIGEFVKPENILAIAQASPTWNQQNNLH